MLGKVIFTGFLSMLLVFAGCSSTPRSTLVPGGEREYCRENPSAALCMGILQEATIELFDNYRYVTDQELYGKVEHWAPLVEKDGVLYGDCEDCIITLVDRMVENGLPAEQMTLYIAEDTVDQSHMVMRYGSYYIDCTEKLIAYGSANFTFLSSRKLTDARWSRHNNYGGKGLQ